MRHRSDCRGRNRNNCCICICICICILVGPGRNPLRPIFTIVYGVVICYFRYRKLLWHCYIVLIFQQQWTTPGLTVHTRWSWSHVSCCWRSRRSCARLISTCRGLAQVDKVESGLKRRRRTGLTSRPAAVPVDGGVSCSAVPVTRSAVIPDLRRATRTDKVCSFLVSN